MRILFVTPYVPSPIRVRPFQLLRELTRRHDVTALALWQTERERADLGALEADCRVVGVRLPRMRALLNCLRALPSDTPLQGAYCRSDELAATVRSFFHEREHPGEPSRFDVVHVEHLRAAHVRPLIPATMPTVFDAVDCISLLLERTRRASHSRKQRLLSMLELGRTRAYEAAFLPSFDRVAVTSVDDARALGELAPGADVSVVPNGVDLDYFRPYGANPSPATLVFSGKMSYHANVTALWHFVDRIFPAIRRERPDVRLRVVGSDPPPGVRALARDPAITVTGHVGDMRQEIGRATIALCPVTVKVGIQNKTLEAMAMGVPVVSTAEGADGLLAQPGRDLLVGSTPDEFAAQVCRLLEDPERRSRVGQAGRAYVERYHRWDMAARQLEDLYRMSIEQHEAQVHRASSDDPGSPDILVKRAK